MSTIDQPCIGPSMPATPPITRGVSLCMIVKNEESNIAACLESVRDLVDEIIVVDTGSTDATKSIAAGFGAKVFDFPWVDSFAAARNESIRHATREWIFWMDADDRLDQENRAKLKSLFSKLPPANVFFLMKCACLADDGPATVVDHQRVFPNDPRIRWKYRCDEEVNFSPQEFIDKQRRSDVVIHHIGYQDPQVVLAKIRRNLPLFQLENFEHPGDPHILYKLGVSFGRMGQIVKALPYFQYSLHILLACIHESGGRSKAVHASDTWTMDRVRAHFLNIVDCHFRLEQLLQSLDACRAGLLVFPNDPDLRYWEEMLLTRFIPQIV